MAENGPKQQKIMSALFHISGNIHHIVIFGTLWLFIYSKQGSKTAQSHGFIGQAEEVNTYLSTCTY